LDPSPPLPLPPPPHPLPHIPHAHHPLHPLPPPHTALPHYTFTHHLAHTHTPHTHTMHTTTPSHCTAWLPHTHTATPSFASPAPPHHLHLLTCLLLPPTLNTLPLVATYLLCQHCPASHICLLLHLKHPSSYYTLLLRFAFVLLCQNFCTTLAHYTTHTELLPSVYTFTLAFEPPRHPTFPAHIPLPHLPCPSKTPTQGSPPPRWDPHFPAPTAPMGWPPLPTSTPPPTPPPQVGNPTLGP